MINVDLTLFEDDEAFQVWTGQMIKMKRLDDLLTVLVQNGSTVGVVTPEQGLQHLADVSKHHPFQAEAARIAVSDFDGFGHTRPFLELGRALNNKPEKDQPSVLLWEVGRRTHEIVGGLWSGKYPLQEKLPIGETLEQFDWLAKSEPEQSPSEEPRQLLLFQDVLGQKRLNNLLLELADCWRELARKLRSPHWWENYAAISYPEIRRLRELLAVVFGPALEPLDQYERGDVFSRHVAFLTKMQWAAAAVHAGYIGRQGIFRERLILPGTYELGSWRLDLLVVESINGNPLTQRQYAIIDRMAQKKYASVCDICYDLRVQFGPHVKVLVHELKSSLGDNPNPDRRIDPGELVNGPLEPHDRKVRTYITLAGLHQSIVDESPTLWGSGLFMDANITYFWPEMLPVTYQLSMTAEEQQALFESDIAASFPNATRAAVIRDRSNVLVGYIRGLVNKRSDSRIRNSRGLRQNSSDTPLFPEMRPSRRIRQIIDSLRKFVDPSRIVEIVQNRRRGGPEYVMHVDVLLREIEANRVMTDRFKDDGGNISCIMPGHEDRHPSMRVYLGRGYARCYVCKLYIPFAPGSVPAHISIEKRTRIKKTARQDTTDYSFDDFEVPAAHFRAMELVQGILRRSFRRSEGERYLAEKRRIDPDLAYANGAGFCTDTTTNQILDSLGFDECVHFGLIGFSSTLTASRGLAPLLRHRGMTFDQFAKREKVKGREIVGLPYFILKDRVSFPLSFGPDRITNFYGRAVWENCPKPLRHRKLLIEHTGVPHGIYNPDALNGSSPFIPVCEGVTDALTIMMQCGHRAIALIGVANFLAFEMLRRSGRKLGIALDNDKAGWDSTSTMMAWFQERGFAGNVHDFTKEFITRHPHAAKYDDFNTWWINIGHKEFQMP